MAGKTKFEMAQPMTLKSSIKKKKLLKNLVWQYLFDNRGSSFTVAQLKSAIDTLPDKVFDRKYYYTVLYELECEPIKNYKVYKDGAYFRIFDKDEREKYLTKLNKEKSFTEILDDKIVALDFQNMWTEKEAAAIPVSYVYFYPMTKEKRYFKEVTRTLTDLFNAYIIAILEGDYNGKNGLYIILKKHAKIEEITPHIQRLYRESSRQNN